MNPYFNRSLFIANVGTLIRLSKPSEHGWIRCLLWIMCNNALFWQPTVNAPPPTHTACFQTDRDVTWDWICVSVFCVVSDGPFRWAVPWCWYGPQEKSLGASRAVSIFQAWAGTDTELQPAELRGLVRNTCSVTVVQCCRVEGFWSSYW